MIRLSDLLVFRLILTFGQLNAVNVPSTSTEIAEAGKTYYWHNNVFNASVSWVNFTIQSDSVVHINLLSVPNSYSVENFEVLMSRVGDRLNVTFQANNVSVNLSSVCLEVFSDDYVKVCKNISVYVPPGGVTCTLTGRGSYPVLINCQINKIFPTSAVLCTLYKRFNGVVDKVNDTFIESAPSNSSLYSSTCSCITSDILSEGWSYYFVNVRNSLTPSSPGLNSSDVPFLQENWVRTAEGLKRYVSASLIYNLSITYVDWVIITSSNTTVVNCTMPLLRCSYDDPNIGAYLLNYTDRVQVNLEMYSLPTDFTKLCLVLDRHIRNTQCWIYVVFVPPSDVNCSLSSPGSSPVVITCQINRVFPTLVLCTLYKKFNGVIEKINETFIGSASSNSSMYSSTCNLMTSDILSAGTSLYFVNVKNPRSFWCPEFNTSELAFDQSASVIPLEAGASYTLTNWVDNTSKKSVDWVVTTSATDVVNCTVGSLSCSATNYRATLENIESRTRANFTFNAAPADLRSVCMVLDRQTKGQACQNFSVYLRPKVITCKSSYENSAVLINCQIGDVIPGVVQCTFFGRQNSTDTVLGYSNGTGTTQALTYKSTCSLSTPTVSWGLNQYFVNIRSSLFPSSSGTNSSIIMFNSDIVSFTSSANGSIVWVTCTTAPALAQVIRLRRKGLGQELRVAYNTTTMTHSVGPFTCSHQDEYICEVNSQQQILILNNTETCPPSLAEPQVNMTYTCSTGGRLALPPITVSSSLPPREFFLLYHENGATYKARPGMYSVHYSPRTLYYGSVDLAVHELTEEDSRQYMFSIRSDQNEGVDVYFTISVEPNDVTDYKPVVTALGILFALLVISVAGVLGVYLYRRYRRSERSEPSSGTDLTLTKPTGVAGSYDTLEPSQDEAQVYYGTVAETAASSKQRDAGTYENTKYKVALKPKNFPAKSQIYGNTPKTQTDANRAGEIPMKAQNTYKNVPK